MLNQAVPKPVDWSARAYTDFHGNAVVIEMNIDKTEPNEVVLLFLLRKIFKL